MSSLGPKQAIFASLAEIAQALGHAHRLELLEHLGQGDDGLLWPLAEQPQRLAIFARQKQGGDLPASIGKQAKARRSILSSKPPMKTQQRSAPSSARS